MHATRSDRLSTSGVPLVLDRFGQTLSSGGNAHPLASAQGLLIGIAAATPLWFVILTSLGGI